MYLAGKNPQHLIGKKVDIDGHRYSGCATCFSNIKMISIIGYQSTFNLTPYKLFRSIIPMVPSLFKVCSTNDNDVKILEKM